MANLATFMATMLFKGKHFSVPRTPTWSNIAIANSPREASATRRTTRSRVLLLRSCFRGCDHKVSLSKQTTQAVLLAYVFLLRGKWTSIPAQKISQGNLVSLRATFSVCAREGPLEVLLFYGVENLWITLQFNDPTIGRGVKGKSRAIVRQQEPKTPHSFPSVPMCEARVHSWSFTSHLSQCFTAAFYDFQLCRALFRYRVVVSHSFCLLWLSTCDKT